jgi:hypothetical protein
LTTGFFAGAALVQSLWRHIGDDRTSDVAQLAREVHRTPTQVEGLLAYLRDNGLAVEDGRGWTLSDAGVAWGASLEEATEVTRSESQQDIKSFTAYVPARWWPEK